jgi:hypothetical protein
MKNRSHVRYLCGAVALFFVGNVLTSGCVADDCTESRWGYYDGTFDDYVVKAEQTTAKGIAYDPSGMPISPELIDRLTDEVETCLMDAGIIKRAIDRQSFVVKIADNWLLNCDKTEQLLPTRADNSGCIAKGLAPDKKCPCRWRAGIQCSNKLIVTPNFYLYKDVLIRFVVDIQNPWASEALAVCASPSTTKLSDGTDPNDGLSQ